MPGVSLDIWDQPAPDDNPAKNMRADPYMQPRAAQPQTAASGNLSQSSSNQMDPSSFPSWDNAAGAQKQQRLQTQLEQHRTQQNHTGPTQEYSQTYSPKVPGPPGPQPMSANAGAYSIDGPEEFMAPSPGGGAGTHGTLQGTGNPFAVNFQTVHSRPPSGPPGASGRIPPGALKHPESQSRPSPMQSAPQMQQPSQQMQSAPPMSLVPQMQFAPQMQSTAMDGVPAITIQLPGWVNILFIVMAILLGIIVLLLFQLAQTLRR
jgi:hypothetical protein